jgi:class 3 adenylate cyclase/CheY-like chemotaxis protein
MSELKRKAGIETIGYSNLEASLHILQSLPQATFVLDRRFRVIFANHAFSVISGHDLETGVMIEGEKAENYRKFISFTAENEYLLERCVLKGKVHSEELTILNGTFETIHVKITLTPVMDDAKVTGLLVNIENKNAEYLYQQRYKRLTNFLELKEDNDFVKSFTILILDDDVDLLHLVEKVLDKEGFDVITCALPSSAQVVLGQRMVDLILLDCNMPGMHGSEFLVWLKNNERTATIPVVMLSGDSTLDNINECLSLGAEDYFVKPMNMKAMKNRIHVFLNTKKAETDRIQLGQANKILSDILPEQTINEIKRFDQSKPRLYEGCGIMFCDIVGFTTICSELEPDQVIEYFEEITCFYEELNKQYGLEKIKTMGDAFISVSGMLQKADDVVAPCLACAKDLMRGVRKLDSGWKLRIGIHYGPIMGGVVGKDKLFFDIWGDTVNTSSRLQGLGDPEQIILSESAYKTCRPKEAKALGLRELKGKDQLMNVYLIEMGDIKDVKRETDTAIEILTRTP